MASITISLPDSMLDFINTQIAGKGDAGVNEYVHGLLRDAQVKAHAARLGALLRDGVTSNPVPLDEAFRQSLSIGAENILDRFASRP